MKPNLLKVKPYKPGKPIEEVKRELGLTSVIKMASNENALGPSAKVILTLAGLLKNLNRYPDSGSFYLKEKLAGKFRLKPENFIIGNGSDEIIVFAIRAFVRPDEEVVIASPTFLIYEIASKVEGVAIRYVPLKSFRYDLASMKHAVTKKTRLVFIANPDNPTGTYVTRQEVERFMRGLRRDVLVFFDEAYYEFARSFKNYPNTLKFLKTRNIIITRSFSKAYSLAGLRIGYGIARPALVGAMERVREPFNVNSLAQAAAIAALGDKAHIKKTIDMVKKGKKYLYDQLDRMEIKYIPSATNFILIRIGGSAEKVYKLLLKKGIIVRFMGPWKLCDYIRVTIGSMNQNHRFIDVLRRVL